MTAGGGLEVVVLAAVCSKCDCNANILRNSGVGVRANDTMQRHICLGLKGVWKFQAVRCKEVGGCAAGTFCRDRCEWRRNHAGHELLLCSMDCLCCVFGVVVGGVLMVVWCAVGGVHRVLD